MLRRQVPEAAAWMRRPAEQNPCNAPIFLCLGRALAHAGQLKETGTVIERLPELHPIGQSRRQHRLAPQEDFEYVLEGARLAGLPE